MTAAARASTTRRRPSATTRAIEQVANHPGNTVAVCRKSYIHPAVLDSYLDGSLLEFLKGRVEETLREELEGLSSEEAAVLAFLQERLARELDKCKRKPRDLKSALRASLAEPGRRRSPTSNDRLKGSRKAAAR